MVEDFEQRRSALRVDARGGRSAPGRICPDLTVEGVTMYGAGVVGDLCKAIAAFVREDAKAAAAVADKLGAVLLEREQKQLANQIAEEHREQERRLERIKAGERF